MGLAKTLVRLGGCPGGSETSLGAQSDCWFCHAAAQIERERYDAIVPTIESLAEFQCIGISCLNKQ